MLYSTVSVSFEEKLESIGLYPLKPTGIEVMQVNVGKMCNQTCKHCHVDAGPTRKEIMTRETMEKCLQIIKGHDIPTIDITGGAPEMNPEFKWFVTEIKKFNRHIMVRCNLTIIVANKSYRKLPEFYKQNRIEVVASLPFFTAKRTDAQRGTGVFEKSVEALSMLNAIGYGIEEGLKLNLVYNPTGAFLPGDQEALENEFKSRLQKEHQIQFNKLYTITNMPINRFLDYLLASGNYDSYMETLSNAFNPLAASQVMCRNMISVGWDGMLYDCDFNQMLELKLNQGVPAHIDHFDFKLISNREIMTGNHCFGCTAGAGSSCGGAVT